jgi:hypothetical protein
LEEADEILAYACYKNERESLSSKLSFFLGMDDLPLKLQFRGGKKTVRLRLRLQN